MSTLDLAIISYINWNVAEQKPIPVRLSEEILFRLDAAAQTFGHKRAQLIRFLIVSWLDYFDRNGRDALPPNCEVWLRETDGRTREARGDPSCPPGSVAAPALHDPAAKGAARAAQAGRRAVRSSSPHPHGSSRKSKRGPRT